MDVHTIYLKSAKMSIANLVKISASYLPCMSLKQKIWITNRKKAKKFKKFNNSLGLYKIHYRKLKKVDDTNAIFVVGSDQVWSPNHLKQVKHADDLYLLKFTSSKNKYSYAPSFGVNCIPADMKKLYKSNIKDFKKVSIREEAGKEILNELSIKDVEIMPDPVFLLKREEWKKCVSHTEIEIKNKYILTYFLGKSDSIRNNEIETLARKMNYKVVNICGNYYNKNDYIASPEEFIELINNAELVLTDSFHAAAFSIIMNTDFFVFKRNDVKQFSRLETLLNKYDLNSCIIDDNAIIGNIVKTEKDKSNINSILNEEKNKGYNYLKKIIDMGRKENINE